MTEHVMQMEDTPKKAYWGKRPCIEDETMFEMHQAVLFRALKDLYLTRDYAKKSTKLGSYGINSSTEFISLGEEVREWFADRRNGDAPFSFLKCCDVCGIDYNSILKKAEPYLVPKNRKLNSFLWSEREIFMMIKPYGKEGVGHRHLLRMIRKKHNYPVKSVKIALDSLEKDGLIGKYNPPASKDRQGHRWYIREENLSL